jgi:hypothetical protein
MLGFFFIVKDLQADLRKTSEQLSELRKRSETFDTELTTTTKNVNEHEKVMRLMDDSKVYSRKEHTKMSKIAKFGLGML